MTSRVQRAERETLSGHRAGVIYLTGLSAAGKSTLAAQLQRRLHERSVGCCVLDGDELRAGLCRDLGFTDADRVENMRRVTEVARLMVDAGVVVITALIAPFRAERDAARERLGPRRFIEVFVDAPLAVCEARDPKGLYARARRGEIQGFTGIDSGYEPPCHADLHVDTTCLSPPQAAALVIAHIAQAGWLSAPGSPCVEGQ